MRKETRAIAIQLVGIPVLFYLGAKLSLAFAVMPEVMVLLWVPNALVLAALLHYGFRRYALFAMAIVVAEIAADYPSFSLIEAIAFGTVNLFEATVAFLLLRRWRFDPRFAAPEDIAKFVIGGPVIATLLSAGAAAGVYSAFRGGHTDYAEFLRVWWFSDAIGLLIMAPLVLSAWPAATSVREPRTKLRWYDVAVFAATAVLVAAFALSRQRTFHGITIRAFLLIPPALYAAARFSPGTANAATAALALLLLFVVKNGQQPFGDLPTAETASSAQELIFVMGAMSLGYAALLSQQRAHRRELEARVRERTQALSDANRQLEQLSVTDALTGALNRRAFFELLGDEVAREHRPERPLALIIFDIDHFKQINDRFGHVAGDNVLRRVAAVTRSALRSGDALARYGGEEFVIVAPETGEENALQLAERVRAALGAATIVVDHSTIRVSASFGVTLLGADDRDTEQVVRRADQALYAAKSAGRDRIIFA